MPKSWCVRALAAAAFLLALAAAQMRESLPDGHAELEITVENAATGAPMPARLYLFRGGRSLRFTPVESMLPLLPDLQYRDHLWKAKSRPATLEVTYKGESHLVLLDGRANFALPAAAYRIDAYRGMFYRPASEEFRLEPGKRTKLTLKLAPWAGARSAEWLSADDHIHITRRREDDDVFLRWIQAEDLSVGNFLQLQRQMDGAVQYAFGRAGEARAPGYSIRPGHESRSFYYGHLNILGPNELQRPLSVGTEYGNSPEAYPFPLMVFERGRALGGTVGYAHFNGTAGNSSPHSAFLMDVALGSIDFTEVFQSGRLRLEDWYAILNAGFRLTGIAGSDFPVSLGRAAGWPRAIPLLGPERTLVRAEAGESAYESWAEGVREGRVVVSNGPLLEFTVNGRSPGEVLRWDGDSLAIEGVAHAYYGSPLERVEVVVNGEVVAARAGDGARTEIELPFRAELKASSWIAARATASLPGFEPGIRAHTNPVYLHRGGVPTWIVPARQALARRWESEVAYYKAFGLRFAREENRREFYGKLDAALEILRGAPRPW